jgi:serine O-acetyltransferase
VIGKGVRLGEDVVVYQNVTLGGRNRGDGRRGQYPTVGDGVVLFAGAVLIGDIEVGSGSVVGANAVVLSDVPCNSVATGVPARVRAVRQTPVQRPSSSPTCQSET